MCFLELALELIYGLWTWSNFETELCSVFVWNIWFFY